MVDFPLHIRLRVILDLSICIGVLMMMMIPSGLLNIAMEICRL